MPRFINKIEKASHFEQALFLYAKYSKFLDDDYAFDGLSIKDYFKTLLNKLYPFFYLIIEDDKVAGFVYLDKIIGDSNRLHCAELSTCMYKRYWGEYSKVCALIFMNYCFYSLGFRKIKRLNGPVTKV